MKINHFITAAFAAALLTCPARAAFDIYHTVDASSNPFSNSNGTLVQQGDFVLRLGFFNYSPDFATNNAMIAQNAANQGALESAFVTYFTFDPAQQAQGDTGVRDDVNGVVASGAVGPGQFYAYKFEDDTTYAALGFAGKFMYAWIQEVGNPAAQLIGANPGSIFAPSTDPLQSTAFIEFNENIAALEILVGNDRTATAFNDYQLAVVPEPSSAMLVLLGMGGAALLRRRRP